MMTELVFYTNPQSCGRIVHWMLEEIGAPYAVEVKDFGTTMKAPDYLTINPMGNVGSHLGVRISNLDPKKPSNVRISSNYILTLDGSARGLNFKRRRLV